MTKSDELGKMMLEIGIVDKVRLSCFLSYWFGIEILAQWMNLTVVAAASGIVQRFGCSMTLFDMQLINPEES